MEETADALEEHTDFEVELPDQLSELVIDIVVGVKKYKSDGLPSRAARLGNAAQHMRAVAEAAEAYEISGDGDKERELRDAIDEVGSCAAELADHWDALEIPGMYG